MSSESPETEIKLLPFHPLADMFPLMEGAEFDELIEDIKKNGLREKIDLYRGEIAEGRNRYRALLRLGIDPSAEPDKYFRKAIYTHTIGGEIAPHEQNNDDRVRAYIISKNIHRRHLTAGQRRDLIAKLLKVDPAKSDRAIAAETKTDHKTVGAVRKEQEGRGEIPHVKTRTDTRGRSQPAKKHRCWQCGARAPAGEVKEHSYPAYEETDVWLHDSCVAAFEAEEADSAARISRDKADDAALRDFARFTIANINSGDLKLSGDPERIRKWRDLKERVESSLKVPS